MFLYGVSAVVSLWWRRPQRGQEIQRLKKWMCLLLEPCFPSRQSFLTTVGWGWPNLALECLRFSEPVLSRCQPIVSDYCCLNRQHVLKMRNRKQPFILLRVDENFHIPHADVICAELQHSCCCCYCFIIKIHKVFRSLEELWWQFGIALYELTLLQNFYCLLHMLGK